MPKGEKSRKLTDEQRELAVLRYVTPTSDGIWIGANSIAAEFGVSANAIQVLLRSRGIPMRNAREAHANGKQCKPIKNLPVGEAPLCKCGCGSPVEWNQRKNRWNVYLGDHRRPDKPYKNPEWLYHAYAIEHCTAQEIADMCGGTMSNIVKHMKKFGIERRNGSAAIIGRRSGPKNGAWKGGVTPERQRLYKAGHWREFSQAVYRRDGFHCQRCGSPKRRNKGLHAHHIMSWAGTPELRFNEANCITVCNQCHTWIHSSANLAHDFLA